MRGAGADSWDYTAPEWIVATQEENTLSVNAKDNTEASRVGRIEFISGNAEASLNSRNFQQTKSSGGFPPELFIYIPYTPIHGQSALRCRYCKG